VRAWRGDEDQWNRLSKVGGRTLIGPRDARDWEMGNLIEKRQMNGRRDEMTNLKLENGEILKLGPGTKWNARKRGQTRRPGECKRRYGQRRDTTKLGGAGGTTGCMASGTERACRQVLDGNVCVGVRVPDGACEHACLMHVESEPR
jgi:hypothetical protein